jgi:hypothetical protein
MDEYIRQLLTEADVPEDLDPEVRNQLENDLKERVSDLISRRLIDAMSLPDAEEFNRLLESQPENLEAMQQFISDHVLDKDRVTAAALLEFRALYTNANA